MLLVIVDGDDYPSVGTDLLVASMDFLTGRGRCDSRKAEILGPYLFVSLQSIREIEIGERHLLEFLGLLLLMALPGFFPKIF